MDRVIGGKFKLGRKIGSGSFGELYIGMICVTYSVFIFGICFGGFYSESDSYFDLVMRDFLRE